MQMDRQEMTRFRNAKKSIMRLIFKSFIVMAIMTTSCRQSFQNYTKTVDLSGPWKFQLDSASVGIQEKWFNKEFNDSIQLAGTTEKNSGIFIKP
jgi:hypothetical protein